MIMKDMKDMINENGNDEDGGNSTLYNLVRGGKSNLLVTNVVGETEFRPQRPRRATVMMTTPFENGNGKDYRPKRDSSDVSSDGEESSGTDDSSSGENDSSGDEGAGKEGEKESLTFQAILNENDQEFEEESDTDNKNESSSNTPSSYKEISSPASSKMRAKGRSPNSPEKSIPNKN